MNNHNERYGGRFGRKSSKVWMRAVERAYSGIGSDGGSVRVVSSEFPENTRVCFVCCRLVRS
jgi:hypothetical protein